MVDGFYKFYNYSFKLKSRILLYFRLDKVLRFLSFLALNLAFRLLRDFNLRSSRCGVDPSSEFYVCLTSFPARIMTLHLVVLSLLLQRKKPKGILLFLSRTQFSSEQSLPKKLLELKDYGLKIFFAEEDVRSYKKYIYVREAVGLSDFVTVDDDIIYPSYLLSYLTTKQSGNKKTIFANRCCQISSSKPYREWNLVIGKPKVSSLFLPTGCGGVYYPASSLPEIAFSSELFSELAPDADDIWLNCCSYYNGYEVCYTGFHDYFIGVFIVGNINLYSKNVSHQNDIVISKVSKFFNTRFGVRIFEREDVL